MKHGILINRTPRVVGATEGMTDLKGVSVKHSTPKNPPSNHYSCGTQAGYVWHQKHKEYACSPCLKAKREYSRIWRENNREKDRKSSANYYAKNKEKSTAATIKWQKANRARINELGRIRYAKDTEKYKKQQQKYRKSHPDIGRRLANKRRARKKNVLVLSYTEKEVLKLYGFNCWICSEPINMKASRKVGSKNWEKGLHIDHLIPISKGGSDTLENVRPTHGLCNLKKGNK